MSNPIEWHDYFSLVNPNDQSSLDKPYDCVSPRVKVERDMPNGSRIKLITGKSYTLSNSYEVGQVITYVRCQGIPVAINWIANIYV